MEQIDNDIRNRQIKGTDTNQVRVDKDGYAIPPTNIGANVNRTDGTAIPPTNRGIDSADSQGTERTTDSKGRDFDGNNRMGGKNSRGVVGDMGNVNVDGNSRSVVGDMGNVNVDGNSRSVVGDMGNVNASPKYRTITNADLEVIRAEMREQANRIAKDIALTNDDLSDLNEPETSLEV